jgi:hypothetical protein
MQNILIPTVEIPDLRHSEIHQISFPITPRFLINNRADKRKFRKDAIRCGEFLQWIIDEFIETLFDESLPEEIEYKTVYLHYLDIWNKSIDRISELRPQVRNVVIDPDFFARHYSPAA